ncbi:metalloregulator ArsR/SmtB family transcription factor [Luteococcus peritonei]|uniref:ArsR/SmtB family transcription factor n=1 Tax=Luteococcus peritonei TaxID=88874 RepID=A0ABW4RTI1_9ACTN
MDDVFSALAHPARRALLDELREAPARAGDVGTGLGSSREAVSKHLRLMAAAGLLHVEVRGRERWYHIRPEALAELDGWLEPYRAFWSQRLDALETEIIRGRRDRRRTASRAAPPTRPIHREGA